MTKRIVITALIAGLSLAAGASAVAAPEPKAETPRRACFFASQLNGWRSERGEDVIYLEVGARDIYRAELFGNCWDIDDAIRLGIRTRGGGTTICDGPDVELVLPSSMGPRTCPVDKLTKLTPEEAKALKARRRG